MAWMDRLSLFQPIDFIAVAVLFVAWAAIGLRIENPGRAASVSVLMAQHRRNWLQQMRERDNRIFDSQILGILRQGTAFFASACMIAMGGTLALIGNAERVASLGNDLVLESDPAIVWEIKLIAVLVLLINAFLKFVWAHRLFGYCAVLMAAVPNDPADPVARPRAEQAGEINVTAARSYNRGLRSIYFAMAATAWLFDPIALLVAVAFTCAVLWRREFASHSRAALLRTP
jgi:uncharacterized membrane protein